MENTYIKKELKIIAETEKQLSLASRLVGEIEKSIKLLDAVGIDKVVKYTDEYGSYAIHIRTEPIQNQDAILLKLEVHCI